MVAASGPAASGRGPPTQTMSCAHQLGLPPEQHGPLEALFGLKVEAHDNHMAP